MKLTAAVLGLLLIVPFPAGMAVDVENTAVDGGDENEGATYSFIRAGDKRFMLPFRTHVNELLHNTERSVWAINYHETSNYDSVDLVVEHGADVFVVPNVWSVIADDVITAKVVDALPERVHFQVLKINDHDLRCRLIGQSRDTSMDRGFSVRIEIVNHEPTLRVAK